MTVVVDASVIVALAEVGPETLRDRFWGSALHAPELLLPEVANSLRRRVLRREIAAPVADAWFAWISSFPILKLHEHRGLATRIWELRHDLTPYDASYVALAERLGATLTTCDRRLARAAAEFGDCEVARHES